MLALPLVAFSIAYHGVCPLNPAVHLVRRVVHARRGPHPAVPPLRRRDARPAPPRHRDVPLPAPSRRARLRRAGLPGGRCVLQRLRLFLSLFTNDNTLLIVFMSEGSCPGTLLHGQQRSVQKSSRASLFQTIFDSAVDLAPQRMRPRVTTNCEELLGSVPFPTRVRTGSGARNIFAIMLAEHTTELRRVKPTLLGTVPSRRQRRQNRVQHPACEHLCLQDDFKELPHSLYPLQAASSLTQT